MCLYPRNLLQKSNPQDGKRAHTLILPLSVCFFPSFYGMHTHKYVNLTWSAEVLQSLCALELLTLSLPPSFLCCLFLAFTLALARGCFAALAFFVFFCVFLALTLTFTINFGHSHFCFLSLLLLCGSQSTCDQLHPQLSTDDQVHKLCIAAVPKHGNLWQSLTLFEERLGTVNQFIH